MRVTLNKGEMAVAEFIATCRRLTNQSASVFDQRRDNKQQAIVLDILGSRSELAWAKASKIYPDLSLSPRRGGFDSVINGIKFDIKSTDRTNGRLLATTGKKTSDSDVYVLAIVSEEIVNFCGYAYAEELLSQSTVTDLGHGPTHALSQSQLRTFTPHFLERIAGDLRMESYV